MRILLVGDYPNDPRLGSAKVPHKLATEFRELGHECDLLFAEDLGQFPRYGNPRHLAGPWLAQRAIGRRFARSGPYDVVDIAGGEGVLFGLRHRLGRRSSTAFISRSNGLEHLNYRRMLDDHRHGLMYKPWTRRIWYPAVRLNQVALAARFADRMVVLNERDRRFVLDRGWKQEDRLSVIGHGISEHFLRTVPPAGAARGAGVLFCGTWTGVKGVDYLVRAFTEVIDNGGSANLTILGGATPADTIRGAFPEHVQGHLTIIDRVPETEVIDQYRRHDLLVFPSTYEGFGMVLLEAMSQRLPVVATPVGSAATLVQDGETGLLVPARDPSSLASGIIRLLGDPLLRNRLAENAFRAVQEMTWRRAAQRTLELYCSAIDPLKKKGSRSMCPRECESAST